MNVIKYFFLRIYSASLSSGENDWGWAFTLVSIFLFANIYSFLDIVLIVTHTKLPEVNNVFIISLGGIVLYFIYVFLIKILHRFNIVYIELLAEVPDVGRYNLILRT